MSLTSFFPYSFYEETIELRVISLVLDQVDVSSKIPKTSKAPAGGAVIDLVDHQDWTELQINFQVSLSRGIAKRVLPENERLEKPWSVVVALKSMSGSSQIFWRDRVSLSKEQGEDDRWYGSVVLHRTQVGSWVQFQAYLVRSDAAEKKVPGFALEKGQRLAQSKQWSVNFDSTDSPLGKSIPIEWVNFKESTNQILRENSSCLFYLDFDGEVPKILLNEENPELKIVLNTGGNSSITAKYRDMIFQSIVLPVWLSLIGVAAEDAELEIEDLTDWKRSVLQTMAPLVFPGESDPIDMLRELQQKSALFYQQVVPAVQGYSGLRKVAENLIKARQ